MIGQLFWIIIAFAIISAVIGALAKWLNNVQEQQAARRAEEERRERAARLERERERVGPRAAPDRPAQPAPAGAVRTPNSEMDRFLAEIDRLRRKQQPPAEPTAAPPPPPPVPVAPVVQPAKPAERPRPRVVAELAEPPATSFPTTPAARPAPTPAQIEELPVATVLKPTVPSSGTGAPATKVTRFAGRPRPASKTNFGKNLTALLGSGQGVAMAVVLQEILGPPRSKQKG